MKVLVVGGGGREHALVWKLRESSRVTKLWCAPGNGGIAEEADCLPVDAGDAAGLVALAERLRPDLTVIGPELPLVNGVGDALRARNLAVVGPSQVAAQLEGSKIFAKHFLIRHGIPTAQIYGEFSQAADAYAALQAAPCPVVVKADGLCAGKGVLVTDSPTEAKDFVTRSMAIEEFGPGGKHILLEEALEGEELSLILVTDGDKYALLPPTRDHKRVFDGNRGPNTGGMGAYSTDELLPGTLRSRLEAEIVQPTLQGLAKDGIRYQGFLYVGLMLTKSGPKVLEFNCRLGDPETQAIMARADFDLAEELVSLATKRFHPDAWKWKAGASACVVISSVGYPGKFATGKIIESLTGLRGESGVKVLHAGTRKLGDAMVTSGGRVLGITAYGPSLPEALDKAYDAAARIRFDGMHYRTDIGAETGRARSAGE